MLRGFLLELILVPRRQVADRWNLVWQTYDTAKQYLESEFVLLKKII